MFDFDKSNSKILIVGAGGIGCELLKTLVLSKFSNVDLIDLDTIDISNLNRQFLFQKKHVGLPKALVAREVILQYRPNININAFYDSILEKKYDVQFYKKYDLVLSALDNISVRYHLNRMCLASNVILIESGTQGYFGQTKPIFKGKSECYDCLPRIGTKTQFASCTIRNTPSEPIHCIVWAKNLFNNLYGNNEDEDSVSPEVTVLDDANEKEGVNVNSEDALISNHKPLSINMSTNQWAIKYNYDPEQMITKLYKLDVEYLLNMGDMWKKRNPPTPLENIDILVKQAISNDLGDDTNTQSFSSIETEHRQVWDLNKCIRVFINSLTSLYSKYKSLKFTSTKPLCHIDKLNNQQVGLTWDKDDDLAINFVAAAANIRSYVFAIKPISFFETKSIAGNIIPAISTTNAIIAGLIVAQACLILSGHQDQCSLLFLRTPVPKFRNTLIGRERLMPPNPTCFSCASKPQVFLRMNLKNFSLRKLVEVLVTDLFISQPDILIDDGRGTLLFSDDEVVVDNFVYDRSLAEFEISDGMKLICEDVSQSYTLDVILVNDDQMWISPEKITSNDMIPYLIADDIKNLITQVAPPYEDASVSLELDDLPTNSGILKRKFEEADIADENFSEDVSPIENMVVEVQTDSLGEVKADLSLKAETIDSENLEFGNEIIVNSSLKESVVIKAPPTSSNLYMSVGADKNSFINRDEELKDETIKSESPELRNTIQNSFLQESVSLKAPTSTPSSLYVNMSTVDEDDEIEVIDLIGSSDENEVSDTVSEFSQSSLEEIYEGNYQGEIKFEQLQQQTKKLKMGENKLFSPIIQQVKRAEEGCPVSQESMDSCSIKIISQSDSLPSITDLSTGKCLNQSDDLVDMEQNGDSSAIRSKHVARSQTHGLSSYIMNKTNALPSTSMLSPERLYSNTSRDVKFNHENISNHLVQEDGDEDYQNEDQVNHQQDYDNNDDENVDFNDDDDDYIEDEEDVDDEDDCIVLD